MEAVRGIGSAMRTLSLGGLAAAREVRPIAPVRTPSPGDVRLQPDTYERGSKQQPLPKVTYSARGSARS